MHTEQIAMKPRHSFLLLVCSIAALLAVIFLLITTRDAHPFRYNYEFFDATNSAATDAVMAGQTGELSLNTSSSDSAARLILNDPGSLRACIAAADVCGTRDGYFKNPLSVGEDMNVTGRFGVGGNTHVNSDLDILGTLSVNGMATISKGTNITGGLGVRNALSTKQNANVLGNISVDRNVGVGGSLSVTNNGTIRGQTHIAGDAMISGPANVRNVANVAHTLIVQGATNVTGSIDTQSHMNVSGNMNVGGNATVGGSAYLKRDAQVNGALSITGPLTVIKNGMYIHEKTQLKGDTSIAQKLKVFGLTKVSGGVNIQSKHGEMTSIGERQDGQNVIYGTTIVKGNKFCLNNECLTSAQLQTIKNNETELSAMLAVWDKEILGDIKTAKDNLDTYTKNMDTHTSNETSTYDSLLKSYETRENSINDLAATKIPSFKQSLSDNWLYEIKQDDRVRQIGRDIVTAAGPYYGAVESTLKPNECAPPPPPAPPISSLKARISLYNDPNYTGKSFSEVYEVNEQEYAIEIKNNPMMSGMEDKISSLKVEPEPGVTASLTLMYHPIHENRRSPDREQTWTATNGQKVEVPDLEKVGNLDDEASAMIIKVVKA